MRKFNVTVNGNAYAVEVEEVGGAPVVRTVSPVASAAPATPAPAAMAKPAAPAAAPTAGGTVITAPMSGTIFKLCAKVGAPIKNGDVALILEAMKMENEIFSPVDGVVKEVRVSEGAAVQPGDVLVVIG